MDDLNALREALLIAQADINSLRSAISALASQQSDRAAVLRAFDASEKSHLAVQQENVRRKTGSMTSAVTLAMEQASRHIRLCLRMGMGPSYDDPAPPTA